MRQYRRIGTALLSGALLLYTTSCQPHTPLFKNEKGVLERILTPEPEKETLSESLLVPIVDAMIEQWLETASRRHEKRDNPHYQDHIIYGHTSADHLLFYE
jgi:hypothetical protein